jgi:hypothetical protein
MPATANRFYVGWRNWLARMIPSWQTLRPGFQNGFKYLWSMVTQVDVLIELLLQGINDWAPGSPNSSPTALPLIGQSRGLLQGETETNDHFAVRLQNWRTNGLFVAPPLVPQVWSQRGRTELMALQIQQYLGNTPLVRVIERLYSTSGPPMALYTTAAPDGTTSTAVAVWDWDNVDGWTDDTSTYSGATVATWWSDFWIVIYPCEYPITGTTLASLVPIWGNPASPGVGHDVPRISADAVFAIVRYWKGLHEFCRCIIWSYDATLFDPGNPGAAGNPNGTWGRWADNDGAGNWLSTRNPTCRYWQPRTG